MFERIKAMIERWQELSEVEAMSDHELDDLGVTREQMRAFVCIPQDVPDRVLAMAEIFGIPEDQVQRDHALYLELLETCCTCGDRGACKLALAKGDLSRPGDCNFCRNARSFHELADAVAA